MTLTTVARPTLPYVLDMARCTDGSYYDDGFTTSDFVGSVLARTYRMRALYSEADIPAPRSDSFDVLSPSATSRLSSAAPSFTSITGRLHGGA